MARRKVEPDTLAPGARARVVLTAEFRRLVHDDPNYSYAPGVYWGPTYDALRDGHAVTVTGDDLAAAGVLVDADDLFTLFVIGADDSITRAAPPARAPGGP